jgi:hypothetical protein
VIRKRLRRSQAGPSGSNKRGINNALSHGGGPSSTSSSNAALADPSDIRRDQLSARPRYTRAIIAHGADETDASDGTDEANASDGADGDARPVVARDLRQRELSRYAYFNEKRRLLVEKSGRRLTFDTGDRQITGVAQSQGNDESKLVFTTDSGPVPLASLTRVDE